jgi:hypothetical protein
MIEESRHIEALLEEHRVIPPPEGFRAEAVVHNREIRRRVMNVAGHRLDLRDRVRAHGPPVRSRVGGRLAAGPGRTGGHRRLRHPEGHIESDQSLIAELREHVPDKQEKARRNRRADDLVCFAGDGSDDHYVPAAVWAT